MNWTQLLWNKAASLSPLSNHQDAVQEEYTPTVIAQGLTVFAHLVLSLLFQAASSRDWLFPGSAACIPSRSRTCKLWLKCRTGFQFKAVILQCWQPRSVSKFRFGPKLFFFFFIEPVLLPLLVYKIVGENSHRFQSPQLRADDVVTSLNWHLLKGRNHITKK